jgi:hypothetical protein
MRNLTYNAYAGAARSGIRAALRLIFCGAVTVAAGHSQGAGTESGLVAHEWGTFTSIAGETGESVEWLPLNGPSDLPGFVEHFRGTGFKLGLGGRLRMETPVLYFYAPRETNVDVSVSFLHGLITEWYPRAARVEPSSTVTDAVGFAPDCNGSIRWESVSVEPSSSPTFPKEAQSSHYYAARATDAAPLRVTDGLLSQHEKFLFYRGVSETAPPLTAAVLPRGRIEVKNTVKNEIPLVVLFERRSQWSGFRQFSGLQTGAILEPPLLDSSPAALRPILETVMVSAGLYPAEAHAMLETWHDSWFQEGSRLIYIVPTSYVDTVLPLSIKPRPGEVHRVFIGRVELLTAATESEIEAAIADQTEAVLKQKYGRFLPAFLEIMLRQNPNAAQAAGLRRLLSGIYATYLGQNNQSLLDKPGTNN